MGVAIIPNAKLRMGLFSDSPNYEERKFFDLENCSSFQLSFSEEEKQLLDYRTGTGGIDASVKRISSSNGQMDLRHFVPANLAKIFWGTTAALSATPITGESGYKVRAGYFTPTKRIIDTGVAPVVHKGGTTVSTSDYTVSAGGLLWAGTITTNGVSDGDSVTIDYTPKLGNDVQAIISTAPEVSLHAEGINQVDGKYWIVQIWKAKLGVAQNVPFIGDDFATFSVSFTAQKDETRLTGSQYFALQINS